MSSSLQRLAVLAAVLALVGTTGAAAARAAVTGVVVAREQARGTLVVAAKSGAVRTLRTSVAAKVGARVSAAATKLADGTYRATSVRSKGQARSARLRAVVVTVAGGKLVLSAGGSVFSIGRTRVVSAVGGSADVQPGDVVKATVSIGTSGDVQESAVQQVGQTALVPLEGTISSLSADTLVLAVEDGAVTTIAIPSSLTLPATIAAGDRVEALTQFAGGTFTLVSIQDDHAAAQSGSGATGSALGQSKVEAEGLVTAVSASSLTVQPEHGSAVTFSVPATVDVSAVQVGDRVHAKGSLQADGSLQLVRLERQNPHEQSGAQEVEAEGSVTAVDSTSLTIQPKHGSAVTFVVPAGIDVSGVAVGDSVQAKGTPNADGTVTLVSLEAKGGHGGSAGTGPGDSNGKHSGSGDSGGSGGSGGSSGSGGSDSGGDG